MPKYLYRVSLIHVEQTPAKSRTKNLGLITQFETSDKREVEREIKRLQEMVANGRWLVPTQITVERSEITDFAPVDIDTLEPHVHNAADAREVPEDSLSPDLQKLYKDVGLIK